MKLHTVMITYNRLDCTKRALASFFDTVTVPFTMTVVDNGSDRETADWLILADYGFEVLLLGENKYPGFACNRGWERAPADADFLQRADNDWEFLPGWCGHVEQAFSDQGVGQVGLRTDREEVFPNGVTVPWNVGGNNIIRRSLWDRGLRYDERPWTELPPGHSEDTYMSPAVEAMGFRWVRVKRPCIVGVSVESIDDPYYRRSWGARRIYGLQPMPPETH